MRWNTRLLSKFRLDRFSEAFQLIFQKSGEQGAQKRPILPDSLFWNRHPALFFSLILLLGELALQLPIWLSLIALSFLILPYVHKKSPLILLFTALVLLLGILIESSLPSPPIDKSPGKATIKIHNIRRTATPFSKGYSVEATLLSFHTKNKTYHDIPVNLFFKTRSALPLQSDLYLIEGSLREKSHDRYHFRPQKDTWQPLKGSLGIAKKRFRIKENIRKALSKSLIHPHSQKFLTTLATGDKEDHTLSVLLARLGLSHLFAISGLHFSCLLGFIYAFFSLLPFRKTNRILLLICIALYTLYLGSSASILRAFCTSTCFLLAGIYYRKTSPLNTLGVALFALLLFFPRMKYSPGFVLSFIATFSLITFYQPMDSLLAFLLPDQSVSTFAKATIAEKFSYLFLRGWRKLFAINLAITLGTAPLIFFLWHTFPLLSLFYNTFFPLLIAPVLFGLLSSLTIHFIFPPLAKPLFALLDTYTNCILQMIYNYPRELGFTVAIHNVSLNSCLTTTLFLIFLGLTATNKKIDQKHPEK